VSSTERNGCGMKHLKLTGVWAALMVLMLTVAAILGLFSSASLAATVQAQEERLRASEQSNAVLTVQIAGVQRQNDRLESKLDELTRLIKTRVDNPRPGETR